MANFSDFFRLHRVYTKILVIILLIWIVVGIFLFFDYVDYSSLKEVKKWWTFVEWIYEPISYLPYRWDLEKNHFYQTLLFPGCEWWLWWNICDISTEDNKTYKLRVKDNIFWSDKSPFILDDVIFSYQDIVVSNIWNQPYLSQYQDIAITQNEDDLTTLEFTFPIAKEDNRDFFKLPIIPYHQMQDGDLTYYVQQFATDPVTLGCSSLKNSKDSDSLIIDVSDCNDTSINYYQIKSFKSMQDLSDHITSNKNIISFYYGNVESPSYNLLPIQDNFFLTMFFNTRSTKLSPRIQRALWWFVDSHLWQDNHTWYMSKYEWLFSFYQSTGANVAEYIKTKNPYLAYDKTLLEQWWVKSLPNIFTIDWAKRKSAFYLDETQQKEYSFTIETIDPVTNLKAKTDKSARYLVTKSENNNKKHTITFSIGEWQQVVEWLNSIIVWGTVLWKKQEIANIDLYYLWTTSSTGTFNKLKIITLDNKISNYARYVLTNIFKENGMEDLFEFVVYTKKDDFLQALSIKDYDMVLSTIQMRWLEDIRTILSSQTPEINPSGYINPVLNQFMADNRREDVRNIFSTDMPFFILGQLMKPYWISSKTNFSYTGTLTDKNIKDMILRHTNIVSHSHVQASKLISKENLKNFLLLQQQ